MLEFSRFKITVLVFICLVFAWLALPNVVPAERWQSVPQAVRGEGINLGLDLRGGSYLLLELDLETFWKDKMENLRQDLRAALREENIGYRDVRVQGEALVFQKVEETTAEEASLSKALRRVAEGLEAETDGALVRVTLSDKARRESERQVLGQALEIVERRVNESGTREPIIQRQGEKRILLQVPGLDNPEHLKRILGKTASMTFHLVNTQVSLPDMMAGKVPVNTRVLRGDAHDVLSDGTPMKYAVFNTVELGGDMLTDAGVSYDQGQPVVSFKFNPQGARKFGEITSQNVGKPFAIVLDGVVITAPRINDAILGGSGIITGNFTTESANDLAILLRAGALPAPLTIVEERSVGPSLGADSIAAGKLAAVVAVIAVMVFMFLFYGLLGMFANIALAINIVILLGALSLLQATLTLPGIAGIVLTLGMAVDANVLIYERIREELLHGRSLLPAVDSGFRMAMGTILDSNITTLIAACVLYYFGTGTVKGFAVTLSFGILSSMFSAIMLTRLMVVIWLRRARPKSLAL